MVKVKNKRKCFNSIFALSDLWVNWLFMLEERKKKRILSKKLWIRQQLAGKKIERYFTLLRLCCINEAGWITLRFIIYVIKRFVSFFFAFFSRWWFLYLVLFFSLKFLLLLNFLQIAKYTNNHISSRIERSFLFEVFWRLNF